MNLTPPTVTGAPATETGKLQQRQTLKADPGEWTNHPTQFTYAWLRCNGLGENGVDEEEGVECEPITSGPQETPSPRAPTNPGRPTSARTIVVMVRATNAHGFSVAGSEPELVLQEGEETEPPAPQLITPPTISGVAVEGHQLTVHRGSWEDEPIGYEEKWFRCKGRNPEGTGGTCKAVTRKNPATGKPEPVTGTPTFPAPKTSGCGSRSRRRPKTPAAGTRPFPGRPDRLSVPPDQPPAPRDLRDRPGGPDAHRRSREVGKRPPGPALALAALRVGQPLHANRIRDGGHLQGRREDLRHTIKVSETVENGAGRSKPATSSATQAVPVPPSSPPR